MKKEYSQAIKRTTKILDYWLPWKIRYDRIPGLAVGIVHDGKILYQKGFGYSDIASKIKISPENCFRIASISKSFTAIAVMQLVEQEKIRLDDKIERYLPWFKVKNKDLDSSNITIRQLLSHTSGVFRDGNTPHWENDKFPDLAGLKKSISNKSLVFENLTRFKYSNFGYALLGEAIKKASGLGYNEYVTKNILEKIGMQRTAPDYSKKNHGWMAKGYSRPIPNKKRKSFTHSQARSYAPATGFLSNVPDLAKFLLAMSLKQKNINEPICKESKKEMMKAYWATGEKNESYGLGFDIYKIENRKIVGHSGGFAGFITIVAMDTENDIGIIVLTNTNDSSALELSTGIFENIFKLIDEKDKYGQNKDQKDFQKYEGVYRSRWDDKIVVGIGEKMLAFGPKTGSPVKNGTWLIPKRKGEFTIDAKSNFDLPGESARFVLGKKTKKLFWSNSPYQILES